MAGFLSFLACTPVACADFRTGFSCLLKLRLCAVMPCQVVEVIFVHDAAYQGSLRRIPHPVIVV